MSNVDKLTRDDELPVRLCNYVDVYKHDYITERPGYMKASASAAEIRRFKIRVDDVVITKDSESWSDIGVPAYAVDEADDLVCGYHLALLRTRKQQLSGEYLFRALQTPLIAHQFHVAAGGVTRYGLSQDDIKSASVPLPPLDEQAAIVKYLGHAHARIDQAIAAKRKLIALLEEQKRASIRQAVTRGLDPTVPTRDSDILWLGSIPATWEVWPVGRLARVGNGSTPSRSNAEYWNNGHFPWLNSSFANQNRVTSADQFVTSAALEQCHLPIVAPGSVLVAITGQGKTRGMATLLEVEATINQHLAYVTPRRGLISSEFLQAVFRSAYAELRSISDDSGSTKGALTCQDLKAFRVPVPPLSAQRAIVEHVAAEVARNDTVIDRAHREIGLLREYRARLTSDLVTGQLDVREIALTLPELVGLSPLSAESSEDEGFDEFDEFDEALEEVDS